MNRLQLIVLDVYLLALAYCCIWIPWYIQNPVTHYGGGYHHVGYAFIWASPEYARPELSVIALRLAAVTALSASAFLMAGMWKFPVRR